MPIFTLHRNFVLRTTKGHSIEFVKGKPTHVPDIVVNDAIAIGAIPQDSNVTVLGEEEEARIQLTPDQRKAAVFKAFETMMARGERVDFTASGVPNAKRIPALTGFELTTTERDEYWREFRANLQEARDQTNLDTRLDKVAGE